MSKVITYFIAFLISMIVITSVGLTMFYFMRNDESFGIATETFSFATNGDDNLIHYTNAGETVDVIVDRKNSSGADYTLVSSDENVIKFKEKVSENVFRFDTADSIGGTAQIRLQSNNEKYKDLSLTVRVGVGSKDAPFYVRSLDDFVKVGKTELFTLKSNYLQLADIDMASVTDWTPIGMGSAFGGTYNGNGHTISNFTMTNGVSTITPSDYIADESGSVPNSVLSQLNGAALFQLIDTDAAVANLHLNQVTIDGDFDAVASLTIVNKGVIKSVKVTNATLKADLDVGGIATIVYTDPTLGVEYSAKILNSSFEGNIETSAEVTQMVCAGGITSGIVNGLIMDSYSRGTITANNAKEYDCIGGISGVALGIGQIKSAVINTYSTMDIDANSNRLGAILGYNVNSDGSADIVLNPADDVEKKYNRIYGNYYLSAEGSALAGIGNVDNATDAYIAMSMTKAAMTKVPTMADLDRINAEGAAFEAGLAYITYARDGTLTKWNFDNTWAMKQGQNDNYPVIKRDGVSQKVYIYNGDASQDPATPIEPVDPEIPSDPDAPIDPDEPETPAEESFGFATDAFGLAASGSEDMIYYLNKGETLEVFVDRKNSTGADYTLVSSNEDVIKFKEKVSENLFCFDTSDTIGGIAQIKLQSNNENYKDLCLTVRVGVGSKDAPFYVRSLGDLVEVGKTQTFDLNANYLQLADIDMASVTDWTPIGTGNAFAGAYNGNGHTISNFTMTNSVSTTIPSDYVADESGSVPNSVLSQVNGAALFQLIDTGAEVVNLSLDKVTIDGDYEYFAALAVVNKGSVKSIKVTNANLKNNPGETITGGIVAMLYVDPTLGAEYSYSAQVLNSSFEGNIEIATIAIAGGVVGGMINGLVMHCYSQGTISLTEGGLGGIVGITNGKGQMKCAIVNNYSAMEINYRGMYDYYKGGIIGQNVNSDSSSDIVLNPTNDVEKGYNRIYGNYYLIGEGSTLTGIGGQENATDAYIAMPATSDTMGKVPTQADLDRINAEGASFDPGLAYITYTKDGTFTTWDFENVWAIEQDKNNNYPFIKKDAVVQEINIFNGIATQPETPIEPEDPEVPVEKTVEDLLIEAFAADLADDGKYNSIYTILCDIELTKPWTPIGTKEQPFNGKFVVKNNSVIKNVVINDCDTNYYGFFGYLGADAEVQSLVIQGLSIELTEQETLDNEELYVGSIAGYSAGSIDHAKVDATINAGGFVGGIVGFMDQGCSITASTVTGELSGKYVGGLVGYGKSGVVSNCSTDCALSGETMSGFAARLLYNSDDDCGKIEYCYSSCSFDMDAGTAYWESASAVRQTTGFFAGDKKLAGYITNCIYNINDTDTPDHIIDSIKRQTAGIGKEFDDGRKTDAECKQTSTFTDRGFDTNIWTLINGQYPSIN